jgi:drug/metabolite transporter (DMT)-like permease
MRTRPTSASSSVPATPESRRSYRWPILALILLAIVWGYSWPLMKMALDYVEPFEFAALRTALGSIVLFALLPAFRRPLRPKAIGLTALLGVLQTAGFVGLLTWALQNGTAGKTSILTYTMPFWLLLMAWVALGERLRGFQWAAVSLALAGLILIIAPWHLTGKLGDFLAIGGAIFWAASAVCAKILRKRHEVDLLSLTAWQGLLGCIPLIVVGAATWTPPHWTGRFILLLLWTILCSNALAWILWLYILSSLSAGTAGLSVLLTPVIGIASSWLQLGERPGLLEGLGMIMVVGALLLTALRELLRGRRSPL